MNRQQKHQYFLKTIIKQILMAEPDAFKNWKCKIGTDSVMGLKQTKDRRAGLRLVVEGSKHKGPVYINLTWADDYTVQLLDKNEKVIETTERIYAPELCRVLDMKIDKGTDTTVQDLVPVVEKSDGVISVDFKAPLVN
jgi:hypothetical protein